MKNKTRKQSWSYLDRALKIQFPPNHLSKKLTLIFLGAKADDHGRSYHGYRSICAHLGFGSKSTVSDALKYLRDELGILTWQHGSGGFEKKNTNRYELNLEAMGDVIAAQGVFDPETGRLKRYEVESTECTESSPVGGLSVGYTLSKVESTPAKVESTQDTSRVQPVYANPQGTPTLKNPQLPNQTEGSVFSASSSSLSSCGVEVERLMAPAPLCGAPPVESHEPTRNGYAGSAVTEKFLTAHASAKSRKLPKTAKELAKAIHSVLQREAPNAPILNALPERWEGDWCLSLGYAVSQQWASLDELSTMARFAVDHKLPEILTHGVPGLVGSLKEIRQQMNETEVKS